MFSFTLNSLNVMLKIRVVPFPRLGLYLVHPFYTLFQPEPNNITVALHKASAPTFNLCLVTTLEKLISLLIVRTDYRHAKTNFRYGVWV